MCKQISNSTQQEEGSTSKSTINIFVITIPKHKISSFVSWLMMIMQASKYQIPHNNKKEAPVNLLHAINIFVITIPKLKISSFEPSISDSHIERNRLVKHFGNFAEAGYFAYPGYHGQSHLHPKLFFSNIFSLSCINI